VSNICVGFGGPLTKSGQSFGLHFPHHPEMHSKIALPHLAQIIAGQIAFETNQVVSRASSLFSAVLTLILPPFETTTVFPLNSIFAIPRF
jgi:hypothetical protein